MTEPQSALMKLIQEAAQEAAQEEREFFPWRTKTPKMDALVETLSTSNAIFYLEELVK